MKAIYLQVCHAKCIASDYSISFLQAQYKTKAVYTRIQETRNTKKDKRKKFQSDKQEHSLSPLTGWNRRIESTSTSLTGLSGLKSGKPAKLIWQIQHACTAFSLSVHISKAPTRNLSDTLSDMLQVTAYQQREKNMWLPTKVPARHEKLKMALQEHQSLGPNPLLSWHAIPQNLMRCWTQVQLPPKK